MARWICAHRVASSNASPADLYVLPNTYISVDVCTIHLLDTVECTVDLGLTYSTSYQHKVLKK
jgi:hypothetical protein